MVFRRITAGSFMMGSPRDENGRSPDNDQLEVQHKVTLTKDYYIGVFEVTQGQYELIMKKNPSHYSKVGTAAPVDNVDWYTARGGNWPDGEPDNDSFIGKFREMTRMNFDLPTEAQWEYACRAGTSTATYAGDISSSNDYRNLTEIAWFNVDKDKLNVSTGPHPVGMKKPNAWGLYDMLGNVAEWCLESRGKFNSLNVVDPTGAEYTVENNMGQDIRVLRGGSWKSFPGACRSAARSMYYANIHNIINNRGTSDLGFRVVLNTGN